MHVIVNYLTRKAYCPQELKIKIWEKLVKSTGHSSLVRDLLCSDSSYYDLRDEWDRHIADLAVPEITTVFREVFLWFGRYRKVETRAEHQSSSCYVFKVIDELDGGKRVALKLMRNRDQFLREVKIRQEAALHAEFIIPVLRSHPEISDIENIEQMMIPPEEESIDSSQLTKASVEKMFCIVMPLAERNLFVASKQERFAGKDWSTVKAICSQLLQATDHLHGNGIIHGDIKPLNIVRENGRWRLIDLDNSMRVGAITGEKYSTAFNPPESIIVTKNRGYAHAEVRSLANQVKYNGNEGSAAVNEYKLLPADFSFDIWSLGCVFYTLCTDCRALFQGGQDDNLQPNEMLELASWSDQLKASKLNLVQDRLARNLLSQMLMKDPTKRPSVRRLLEHPFFTGKKAVRMRGDEAQFDVFISYRDSTDARHARDLYEHLRSRGLKVWWDQEKNFCAGLVNSRLFVPIFSRGGLKDFASLDVTSSCDTLFLEYRLSLELLEMGLLGGIFPLIMGEPVETTVAVNHSSKDIRVITWAGERRWLPSCRDESVSQVDEAVSMHLSAQALGSPLYLQRSVRSVMEEMKKMQGALIEGEYQEKMQDAANRIHYLCSRLTQAMDDDNIKSTTPVNEITTTNSYEEVLYWLGKAKLIATHLSATLTSESLEVLREKLVNLKHKVQALTDNTSDTI